MLISSTLDASQHGTRLLLCSHNMAVLRALFMLSYYHHTVRGLQAMTADQEPPRKGGNKPMHWLLRCSMQQANTHLGLCSNMYKQNPSCCSAVYTDPIYVAALQHVQTEAMLARPVFHDNSCVCATQLGQGIPLLSSLSPLQQAPCGCVWFRISSMYVALHCNKAS